MIITINPYHKHPNRKDADIAVAEQFAKLHHGEQAEFIGRLVNLLLDRQVITPTEAGNLFFEDWK